MEQDVRDAGESGKAADASLLPRMLSLIFCNTPCHQDRSTVINISNGCTNHDDEAVSGIQCRSSPLHYETYPSYASPVDPFLTFLERADLQSVPSLVDGERYRHVSAGVHHTAAITSRNRLLCWGKSGDRCWNGRLALAVDEFFETVSAGCSHTSVVTSLGRVLTWDLEGKRQCPQAPQLSWGEQYISVSQGKDYGLALTSKGTLTAWKANDAKELEVPKIHHWEAFVGMSAKLGDSPVAITTCGRVLTWNLENALSVTEKMGETTEILEQTSSGFDFTVALSARGLLFAWGEDSHRQISRIPELPLGERFTHVSAGGHHVVALTTEGRLLAWGNDDFGQCSRVPNLYSDEYFKEISAGAFHTAAITSKGRLFAWGCDDFGQCTAARPLLKGRRGLIPPSVFHL